MVITSHPIFDGQGHPWLTFWYCRIRLYKKSINNYCQRQTTGVIESILKLWIPRPYPIAQPHTFNAGAILDSIGFSYHDG